MSDWEAGFATAGTRNGRTVWCQWFVDDALQYSYSDEAELAKIAQQAIDA